jgi:hypothetical protein
VGQSRCGAGSRESGELRRGTADVKSVSAQAKVETLTRIRDALEHHSPGGLDDEERLEILVALREYGRLLSAAVTDDEIGIVLKAISEDAVILSAAARTD